MINVEDKLKILSERLNVPLETIEKEYEECVSKLKIERKDLTEESLIKKGFAFIRGIYSKQIQSTAKNFSCYILGYSDSYDPYKRERSEAEAKGFFNEDGKPVFFDPRPSLSWRKDRPIPSAEEDSSTQRVLYGLFQYKGSQDFKPGIFYLQGKNLNENLPELFTEYNVRAGCKEEILQKSELLLNTSAVTRFIKIGKEKIDLENVVGSLLPNNITPLDKLDDFKSDSVPLGLFITKGIVVAINITKDEVRSNAIELTVEEEDIEKITEVGEEGGKNVTIWVSKEYPIDFGVNSEIIVLGRKYIGKDNIPSYSSVGIYVKYNSSPIVKPQVITKENGKAKEDDPKSFLKVGEIR